MTARQRLEAPSQPRRRRLRAPFAGVPAGSLLYVSTPRLLTARLRRIPVGELMSVAELRDRLAAENAADTTCPVTTAMFLRIVTEVAMADLRAGAPIEDVTPFWRVLEPDGPITARVDGAAEVVSGQRRLEQHDAG